MDTDAPLAKFEGIEMPDEMIAEVNRYLPLPAQVAFTRVSKSVHYGINRYGIFQSSIHEATDNAQILKWQVLHGFQDEASELMDKVLEQLQEKPYLFFIETAAVPEYAEDHKGNIRMFEGSAFEAALAMGYTQLLKSEIVQEIIKANPNVVARQIEKQFPNGFNFPLKNEAAIDRAFDDFVRVLNNDKTDISTAKKITNPILEAATEKFKDTFPLGVINQGWLFDLRILVKAIETLRANWGNWNYLQQDWFACQIYGYLQTLVSTFDAQVISEGIENVMNDGKIGFVPSFLTLESLAFYYPVGSGQFRDDGTIGFVGANGLVRLHTWTTETEKIYMLLKSYIEQKCQLLGLLTDANTNQPVHTR